MGIITEVLKANQEYARNHELLHLSPRPRRKLAILTCMDTRLSIQTLGLKVGDAHIIRNAGGLVTEDSLRSLLISHHLLGTEEVMIINHTDCGLLNHTEAEILERVSKSAGTEAISPARFHAFTDLDANVREQMEKLFAHPWLPQEVTIRGFVYDVQTGRLREVER